MKKIINLLSLVALSIVFTACNDVGSTTNSVTVVEAQSYSISGDVKGCVTDASSNPVEGATATLGNVSALTDADGCYSLTITITTMNSKDSSPTVFDPQEVVVTHERFLDTNQTFTPTENVVAGVIKNFGTYVLNTDGNAPNDLGAIDAIYSNNMLKKDINGSNIPFKLELSEFVELAANISNDTIISIQDENQTDVVSTITATVSFSGATNILSITTSEDIPSGYYVTIRIPSESITDVNGNEIITGTDATVSPYGPSLTDYLTLTLRIFAENDLNAEAVTTYSQMDEDSSAAASLVYDERLSALDSVNSAFKNVLKNTSKQIFNFNSGGTVTSNRLKDLANAYISDTNVSVTTDTLRIKFTPTNAAYYIIKAYDDSDTLVPINCLDPYSITDINVTNGKCEVVVSNSSSNVELLLFGLDANTSTGIAIVPYSAEDTAGTASYFIVKDNVAPTTSLQYSYGVSDDTSSDIITSGGVVTSVLYGGSGETSNPEDYTTPVVTTLTIGTPYMHMTNNLLFDQNATSQNTGLNTLVSPYTSSDYSTWILNNERSIGIGFTEAININGNATLTKADSTPVSGLITQTVNTVDNRPVTSAFTGLTEDIAIVTVSDIFTLVNEHNGSVIDLTSIATDLAGNVASSAKVILLDKVAPYVVSADINSTDPANSTVTFSEDIKAGSLWVGAANCTVNDGNISANVVYLTGCGLAGTGVQNIDFSTMPDMNGNFNLTHTFDANVTN